MTNGEKFKTAKERDAAFVQFCSLSFRNNCNGCPLKPNHINCQFYWLELEAEEEKPLPCPFCGGSVVPMGWGHVKFRTECVVCGYSGKAMMNIESAIQEHNRVVKAVKESEAKK